MNNPTKDRFGYLGSYSREMGLPAAREVEADESQKATEEFLRNEALKQTMKTARLKVYVKGNALTYLFPYADLPEVMLRVHLLLIEARRTDSTVYAFEVHFNAEQANPA